MRIAGTLLVGVFICSGAVFADSKADPVANGVCEPLQSLDSIGTMFLELSRESDAVKRLEQLSKCEAKEVELNEQIRGLRKLLALSGEKLRQVQSFGPGPNHRAYNRALISVKKKLIQAKEYRQTMRVALNQYRALMLASAESGDVTTAEARVLADVEEVLEQAEAALASAQLDYNR